VSRFEGVERLPSVTPLSGSVVMMLLSSALWNYDLPGLRQKGPRGAECHTSSEMRIYFFLTVNTGTTSSWPVLAKASRSLLVSGAKITNLPSSVEFRERTVRSFP
jgi:hypothetical protein